MSDELRTIRLYGTLGAKFGRVHKLAVDSVAEAVQALSVILPGFEKEILNHPVGYACFIGKKNLSENEIANISDSGDIRIAPGTAGAKNSGLFTFILGAALFFAAPYLAAAYSAAGTATLAQTVAFGTGVATLGKALMIMGVLQAIVPQQKGIATQDGPDNGASYNFNGPVNTTAQGNPAPVLYGNLIIGSATISAGIYSEDQQ